MASIPDLREYTQLPVGSIVETDRLGAVRSRLADLEQGNIGSAAQLWEAMLRDDKVRGALDVRINSLIGSPLEFRGGDEAFVERLRDTNDQAGLFHQICPPASLAELKRWGLGLGFALAEWVWQTDGAEWMPRLKVWHPQTVYWRWDTRSFWVITYGQGSVELPKTDGLVHSNGKWLVYTPYGYEYGWRRGLLEPLAELYLAHRWNRRDFARWSEKHGIPTDLVKVPARARQEEKNGDATVDNLINRVANRGSEAAIELPQGDTPEASFSVELLEAKGESWRGFESFSGILESAIDALIIGRQSTKGTGLDGGKAESGNQQVRTDLAMFDARTLGAAIQQQGLYWFAAWNLGDPEAAPLPVWQVEPAEDKDKRADELQKIAAAMPGLRQQGADIDALAEEHGIAMLPEGERPDPNPAPVVVGPDGKPVPPGGAKPDDGDEAGLKELADRVLGAFTAGRSGIDFRDRLATMAAGAASDELEPDLRTLRQAIRDASDYHDLRRRLVAAYKAMKPEALAKVIERANLLANLAGRARPA